MIVPFFVNGLNPYTVLLIGPYTWSIYLYPRLIIYISNLNSILVWIHSSNMVSYIPKCSLVCSV